MQEMSPVDQLHVSALYHLSALLPFHMLRGFTSRRCSSSSSSSNVAPKGEKSQKQKINSSSDKPAVRNPALLSVLPRRAHFIHFLLTLHKSSLYMPRQHGVTFHPNILRSGGRKPSDQGETSFSTFLVFMSNFNSGHE